jgi:phosphoesterase RecJ-like protein
VGAGMALREILRIMGKKSRVECCEEIPSRYDFIAKSPDFPDDDEYEPDIVISVDIADPKLLGCLREKYDGKIRLCIDHHISNTDYAESTLLYPKSSAACEVIYYVAKELGVELNEFIASCIYTGMATDTGCFKFDNTTPECHEIAADLIRNYNIRYAAINRAMFDVKSMGRIKAECVLMSEMEYLHDGKIVIGCITEEMIKKNGIDSSELDGCAGLTLQSENVEVGVLLKEREPDVFKVSMRSAGDVNVSEICGFFGGGGHIKASGCLIKGELSDVKRRIAEKIGEALGE